MHILLKEILEKAAVQTGQTWDNVGLALQQGIEFAISNGESEETIKKLETYKRLDDGSYTQRRWIANQLINWVHTE